MIALWYLAVEEFLSEDDVVAEGLAIARLTAGEMSAETMLQWLQRARPEALRSLDQNGDAMELPAAQPPWSLGPGPTDHPSGEASQPRWSRFPEADVRAGLALWLHDIFERQVFELPSDHRNDRSRRKALVDLLALFCAYFPDHLDHLDHLDQPSEDCRESLCHLAWLLEDQLLDVAEAEDMEELQLEKQREGSFCFVVMSCRLCLEPGDEATGRTLLSPCACRGSLAHVHADCLLEWCDHSKDYKRCSVCHQCLGSASERHFVGPAALLAARHRFRGTEHLAEEDPEVLEATYQVAQALAGEGCWHISTTSTAARRASSTLTRWQLPAPGRSLCTACGDIKRQQTCRSRREPQGTATEKDGIPKRQTFESLWATFPSCMITASLLFLGTLNCTSENDADDDMPMAAVDDAAGSYADEPP
eukprot:Skav233257  [mRNA]  locus=scaffold2371:64227:68580:- [translate_table: standard]